MTIAGAISFSWQNQDDTDALGAFIPSLAFRVIY